MYQALYRKYRPTDFDSVVGQNVIIKTLRNSIIHHTFSHAYMFFGPRGTGKTTVSKIFARNVNCLNPKNGIACHECDNCMFSFSKECVDIIEIDAASNNGVDEIRELKNKISLVPSQLKYKVYIIDEVHMLSIGAFNALLKTLEEPPEHAIFILATTDPQKVPETIISRCQCFSFKRISSETIRNRLKYVCEEEKISIDDDVLQNIALLSEGGMRDALGLLDKLSSYCDSNEKITMKSFVEVNGIISQNELFDFLSIILTGNIEKVLQLIKEFDLNGKNLLQIMIQLLDYARNLVVDYYLKHTSYDFSISLLQSFTSNLNEKMFDIKRTENVQVYVEMFLLKFMSDYCINSKNDENRLDKIVESKEDSKEKSTSRNDSGVKDNSLAVVEKDVFLSDNSNKNNSNVAVEKNTRRVLNIDEILSVRINNTFALANKDLLKKEVSAFDMLKDYTFDQNFGYIVCSLLDAKLRAVSPENMIISFEYDSMVDQNLEILDKITEVYNKITNSNKKIAIVSDNKWEELKKEYIKHVKEKVSYEVQEEPQVILEDLENNDIISNSAVELFGDIVEIE